jgi:N6-adenosine-specific RNA methylase IME4
MSDLIALAMALAQTAGFVVVIILLGHGMVELPRSLWRWGDDQKMLNYYYFKVARCDDQCRVAAGHWMQCLETVRKMAKGIKELPELQANFKVHIISASCLNVALYSYTNGLMEVIFINLYSIDHSR